MPDRTSALTQLTTMFNNKPRVTRAIKVYEKNYNVLRDGYRLDIICEIVCRLQVKDSKKHRARTHTVPQHNPNLTNHSINYSISQMQHPMHMDEMAWVALSPSDSAYHHQHHGHVHEASQQQSNSYFEFETAIQTQSKSIAEKPQEQTPFVPFLSRYEVQNLCISDDIDYRRDDGKFAGAKMFDQKNGNIYLYYHGHSREHAFRSDAAHDFDRFASFGSVSARASKHAHRVKIGDKVQINTFFHNQSCVWTTGEIIQRDHGQVQVQYYCNYTEKTNFFWTHLDNHYELQVMHGARNLSAARSMSLQLSGSDSSGGEEQKYVDYYHYNQDMKRLKRRAGIKQLKRCLLHSETSWTLDIDGGDDDKIDGHEEGDMVHVPDSLLVCVSKEMYSDGSKKTLNDMKRDFHSYRQANINYFQSVYERYRFQYEQQSMPMLRSHSNSPLSHVRRKSKRLQLQLEQTISFDDKIRIEILSELFNVRIRVYRARHDRLSLVFGVGDAQHTTQLPLVMLAMSDTREFFVLRDGKSVHARPLRPQQPQQQLQSQQDEISVIRQNRLISSNEIYRFYYDLFCFFNPHNLQSLHLNQLSQFLYSSHIDVNVLHKIYAVTLGPQTGAHLQLQSQDVDLHAFVCVMNGIFVAQQRQTPHNGYEPSSHDRLLTDLNLDAFYNSQQAHPLHACIPIMEYPTSQQLPQNVHAFNTLLQHEDDNDDYEDMYTQPLMLHISTTQCTPTPPAHLSPLNPVSAVGAVSAMPNFDSKQPQQQLQVEEEEEEGKAPELSPSPHGMHMHSSSQWKRYEFERFFNENVNCPQKQFYFNAFLQNGYNSIDVLLFLDEATLIQQCRMDKVYAKLLMDKINDFRASYQRFKKFIIQELNMDEYWHLFGNVGCVTFHIVYQRVKSARDIANIIGDAEGHDAALIFSALPRVRRRTQSGSVAPSPSFNSLQPPATGSTAFF